MNNEFDNKRSIDNTGESNNAKRLRLLGDSASENIHLEENRGFKGAFWPNLWFRYKWVIIISSIFLVIAVVILIQFLTATKYDVSVFYSGPEYIVDIQNDFSMAFKDFAKDTNGDGEKNVLVTSTVVMTEEQMRAAAKGNQYDYLAIQQANKDSHQTFSEQLVTGKYIICLIDPHLYEEYSDVFANASDVLGEELDPGLMYAPNAIYFKRTAFGNYYDCFKRLPNDTLLCIMLKNQWSSEDDIEASKELYNDILNFKS